jgi:hypothetical protein
MIQVTGVIQEAEHVVRHQRPSVGGLCRDCSKAATCTFPRDPSRPVWSCDEFDGSNLAPTHPPARDLAAAGLRTVTEELGEATELKGLCRECTNRFTCCYPKPLGGVWHCDELA